MNEKPQTARVWGGLTTKEYNMPLKQGKRRSTMPWFKCYPRDFFEGTEGMDAELRGYYALVLMLIYERDGELLDDDRYIAMRLGMSPRKWRSVRARLLEIPRKLMAGGGYIINFRATEELHERREYQEKQSARRRNSGGKTQFSAEFGHETQTNFQRASGKAKQYQQNDETADQPIQTQTRARARCKNHANIVAFGGRRDMDWEEGDNG